MVCRVEDFVSNFVFDLGGIVLAAPVQPSDLSFRVRRLVNHLLRRTCKKMPWTEGQGIALSSGQDQTADAKT